MRTSTIHSAALLIKSIAHTQSRIWLCAALVGMIVSCGKAPVGGLKVGLGIPRMGVGWGKNEFPSGFKVSKVDPNMAASGKIHVGDVITHLGKRKVTTWRSTDRATAALPKGKPYEVTLIRNGKRLSYQLEWVDRKVHRAFPFRLYRELQYRALDDQENISIVCVVGSVHAPAIRSAERRRTWENAVKETSQSMCERRWKGIRNREGKPAIKVLDRNRLNFALQELKATTSDLYNPKIGPRIGKLIGATHFVEVSRGRFRSRSCRRGYEDSWSWKLINISTGEILVSQRNSIKYC